MEIASLSYQAVVHSTETSPLSRMSNREFETVMQTPDEVEGCINVENSRQE